jgi:MoaA/NifB/PqqE/SkfB family radical SAM enzyme
MQLSAFGEPLMTPRMEQKLEDLERYGVKLEMVTNATLMMRESRFREQLLRNLELVTFSMDGATRQTYNSVRTGADFDEVVGNISAFCARRIEIPEAQRPRMHFNFILMRRTVAEAPRFVEMVHRWGGDEIAFNHLVAFHPSLQGECLSGHRAYANEHMRRTREVAQALGVKINIPPDFATGAGDPEPEPAATDTERSEPTPAAAELADPRARPCGPPPLKCWFLWKRVYLTPFGDVVPCCLASMPHFGTMRDKPFWDVWNNDTYQDYRRHVYTDSPVGACRTCYLVWQSPELTGDEGFRRY